MRPFLQIGWLQASVGNKIFRKEIRRHPSKLPFHKYKFHRNQESRFNDIDYRTINGISADEMVSGSKFDFL
jgi:hypothetical protein